MSTDNITVVLRCPGCNYEQGKIAGDKLTIMGFMMKMKENPLNSAICPKCAQDNEKYFSDRRNWLRQ